MRNRQVFVTLLALLLLVGNLTPLTSAQRKMNIAIVAFEFNTADRGAIRQAYGDVRNLGSQLADLLQTQVVNLDVFTVVERSRVDQLMKEHSLIKDEAIDPETAAKFKRMLGADALVLGSVTSFEMDGLPENGQSEKCWKPEFMSARLGLSFRLVDSSTAQILEAHDVIGEVAAKERKPTEAECAAKESGIKKVTRLGMFNKPRGPSVDDYKRIIRETADDAIAKMAQGLGNLKAAQARPVSAKAVVGRVISVEGKMLFIRGLDATVVKEGDRLVVRRPKEIKDAQTGQTIKTSVKLGEVEIMEIQAEVMIGTFSGAETPRVGDTVTSK